MKKRQLPGGWIFWAVCLVISAAAAVLMPVPRNACYFVTLLALIAGLVLSAIVLVKVGKDPEAPSGIAQFPLSQVIIGIMLMQLIVGLILLALSGVCPWLIAALVECVALTVDAFALSPSGSGDKQEAAAPASPDQPE